MPSPSPSAAEILQRTRQIYCECTTYQDTGEVTLGIATAALPQVPVKGRTDVWRFSTTFVRPDGLRFECAQVAVGPSDDWRRAIAWGRDGAVHSWSSYRPGLRRHVDLHEAAARASVGAPSALQVLTLLVPVAGTRHSLSEDGRLVGIEALDGVECFVIEVDVPSRGTLRVHVDRTSFLLIRTDETIVLDRATHEESHRRLQASLDSGEVPEERRDAVRESLARDPSSTPEGRLHVVTQFVPSVDRPVGDKRFLFTPRPPSEESVARPARRAMPLVEPPSVSASEVLARMRAAYRSCSTYLDSGEVTITFEGSKRGRRHTKVLRFSTAFVRSGGFRFEFKAVDVGTESEWAHYVIWSAGRKCRSWWTVRPVVEPHRTLNEACGAARGVSSASSCRVPTLLEPDEMSCDALPFDAQFEGTDRIDGCSCYVLVVQQGETDSLRLWIDERSLLLRRVEERELITAESQASMLREAHALTESESGRASREEDLQRELARVADFAVVAVTTYRPTVDVVIAPDRFAFSPPFVGPPNAEGQ